jgi:hypothetical protein
MRREIDMKRALTFIGLMFFLTFGIVAQQVSTPFAKLDRQVGTQHGGWNGDKSVLSTIFAHERKDLGERFESELLRYIAEDSEKHYWISAFLEEPSYLHGSQPLPYLSLLIQQQGLSLLRGKSDEISVGRTVSLNIMAAVQSQKLGLSTLASSFKNDAERMLTANSNLCAYFPAVSEADSKIYDDLRSDVGTAKTCRTLDDEYPDRPKTRVMAGVLNTRATSLPLPDYPLSLREVSGEVIVSIVFDESGKR